VGYRLGIDLGATTAVAVVADDTGAVRAVPLGREAVVPAAVLVDANGSVRCGDDAIAGGTGAPDRLVRRFIQRIGDEVPITAGPAGGNHLRMNAEDLTAAMVAWVVARATAAERSVPEAVALVHPAGWAAHKSELMQRALAARGLGAVRLINAAAAVGHVWIQGVGAASGDAFAVFDLGGESVGTTVLRVDTDGRAWPLGVPTVRQDLGGVDFDDAVLRHVLEALDPTLRQALSDDASSTGAPALDALRQACRKAKETLSAATDATVEVHVAGRRVPTRITRVEFETEVAEIVRHGVDLLIEATAAAGLRPGDLSGIMLCGGTSAVPLIIQQLSSRLGPAVRLVREPHPAFTAAAGAALLCGLVAGAVPEPQAPSVAPERPALDVPTVVGRKSATIPSARVEQADPVDRWGSIRITPMRKSPDPAAAPDRSEAKAQAKAAAEREKALVRQVAAEQKAATAEREALENAAAKEREARERAAAKERADAERATRQAELEAERATRRAEHEAEQAFAHQAAAARTAAARQDAAQARAAREQAAAQRAAEQEQAAAHLAADRDRVLAQLAAERDQAVAELAVERDQAVAQLAVERERAAGRRAQAAARQATEREEAAQREATEREVAEREEAAARQAAQREPTREQSPSTVGHPAEARPMPAAPRPEPTDPLSRPARPGRRGARQPVVPAPPVTARSVVAPRELGSLADLLGTAAPRRIPRSSSAGDARTEVLPDWAAEFPRADSDLDPATLEDTEYWEYVAGDEHEQHAGDEQDCEYDCEYDGANEDYEEVGQQLWRRGLAVCRPRRVLTVAAIAMALFVGADGWQEATAPIVGGNDSTSASDVQSATTGDTGSAATHSGQATTRVDRTDSSHRASVLPR
jgi:molecular chaperone DnaK (HSP70)